MLDVFLALTIKPAIFFDLLYQLRNF